MRPQTNHGKASVVVDLSNIASPRQQDAANSPGTGNRPWRKSINAAQSDNIVASAYSACGIEALRHLRNASSPPAIPLNDYRHRCRWRRPGITIKQRSYPRRSNFLL